MFGRREENPGLPPFLSDSELRASLFGDLNVQFLAYGVQFDVKKWAKERDLEPYMAEVIIYEWYEWRCDEIDFSTLFYYSHVRAVVDEFVDDPSSFDYLDLEELRTEK